MSKKSTVRACDCAKECPVYLKVTGNMDQKLIENAYGLMESLKNVAAGPIKMDGPGYANDLAFILKTYSTFGCFDIKKCKDCGVHKLIKDGKDSKYTIDTLMLIKDHYKKGSKGYSLNPDIEELERKMGMKADVADLGTFLLKKGKKKPSDIRPKA